MDLINDEEAFLSRVQSFQVERWFAKPASVSPMICASRGWSNTGKNILTCLSCNATLTFPSSMDLLRNEEEHLVEDFVRSLEWEHDADCVWCEDHCPEEFHSLTGRSVSRLQQEIVVRFLRLNTLWDLPRIQSLDVNLLSLEDSLKEELKTRIEMELVDGDWESRIRILTLLAVTGWELSVLDHKFQVQQGVGDLSSSSELSSGFELLQSESYEEVEDLGYCFSQQSVLTCKVCNAVFGLWTLPSKSFISFEKFQDFAKLYCQKMNFSLVDEETGEVQDLFIKQNDSGLTNIAEEQCQSTEDVDTQRTGPVFDLHCTKKQKLDSESVQSGTAEFLHESFNSTLFFHPVKNHRLFCPYRVQWDGLVKHVVNDVTANKHS